MFVLCGSIIFVVYAKINGKHILSISPYQTDQTQSPYRTFVFSRIMKANPFYLWSSRFVQNRIISYQIATLTINMFLNIVPKKLLWILQIYEFISPSVVRILFWIGSSSLSKGSIFWRLNNKLYEWLKSKPFHNLLQSTLLNNSIRIFVQWLVACFLFWDWKRCGGDWGFGGSFLTYSWGRAPDRAKLAERLEWKGSSRTQCTHMSINIEKVVNFYFVSRILFRETVDFHCVYFHPSFTGIISFSTWLLFSISYQVILRKWRILCYTLAGL